MEDEERAKEKPDSTEMEIEFIEIDDEQDGQFNDETTINQVRKDQVNKIFNIIDRDAMGNKL